MTLKTFPDGSEFTLKHVAASIAFGFAVAGVGLAMSAVHEKIYWKRYHKKLNKK